MSPFTNILFYLLIISFQNIDADPYPHAVVSLWRLDQTGRVPKRLISVAALITPNFIFTLKLLLEDLRPLKTIGFYTGRSFEDPKKMENSVIINEIYVQKIYALLAVVPAIVQEETYMIDNLISCDQRRDNGYFIGWNSEIGATKVEVIFEQTRYFQLTEENFLIKSDFPLGSFITKGNQIIAVHSTMYREKYYKFHRISIDMTETIQNIFDDGERLKETRAGPYPDAVVSFWSVNRQNVTQKLLYVGALIKPDWILVPSSFFKQFTSFENLRIYTGRQMRKDKIIEDSPSNFINFKIVGTKVIGDYARLIILIMRPGIRLPTPYVVTNLDSYGKTSYSGDLVGWGFKVGAISKNITLDYLQTDFHLTFHDNDTNLENFPLGSFLVKGEDLIAFFLGIDNGQPNFLQLYRSESEEIRKIFRSEEDDQSDCRQPEEDKREK